VQGYVQTEITSAGIAHITFFHPNHNSLPSLLLQGLVDAFVAAGKDPAVKAIVLRSAEHKTFCAGASFDELVAIQDYETSLAFFSGFGNVINAMRRCPKIIVGRIHGKAVGGGVGLAAGTDYCMASQYGSVRLSELAVGFGPFVIGPAVERKVGAAAFSQMALNPGEWQTAAWAKEKRPVSGGIRYRGAAGRLHRTFHSKSRGLSPGGAFGTEKNLLAGYGTLGYPAGRTRRDQRTAVAVGVYEACHRSI
jgi:methylglutaconyl-CoA hydratase